MRQLMAIRVVMSQDTEPRGDKLRGYLVCVTLLSAYGQALPKNRQT